MAIRTSRLVSAVRTRFARGYTDETLPSGHLPGQLIIRFKKGAVEHLAAHPVAAFAKASIAAAAMPEEVVGPLELLRQEAGMLSIKSLFVTAGKPMVPRAGVM